MRRSLRIWTAAALGASLALAAPASAQMTAQITDWPGRSPVPLITNLNTQQNAVRRDECESTSIELLYQMVPTTATTLFYFQGNNCELDTPVRDSEQSACLSLMFTEPTNMNPMVTDTVALSQLLDCASSETTRQFYVMAMNTASDTVTAAQYYQFTMQFDFAGPAAPTSLSVADGENEVTLQWTAAGEELDPYEVYIDPAGCADGATPAGALVDQDPPPTDLLVTTVEVPGNASTARIPVPSTVAIGDSFAVGLRAIDQAGNPSTVSVTCARKIDVTSFWEAYCSGPDASEACRGSGCRAVPGGGGAPAGGVIALMIGLAWTLRRSRR